MQIQPDPLAAEGLEQAELDLGLPTIEERLMEAIATVLTPAEVEAINDKITSASWSRMGLEEFDPRQPFADYKNLPPFSLFVLTAVSKLVVKANEERAKGPTPYTISCTVAERGIAALLAYEQYQGRPMDILRACGMDIAEPSHLEYFKWLYAEIGAGIGRMEDDIASAIAMEEYEQRLLKEKHKSKKQERA